MSQTESPTLRLATDIAVQFQYLPAEEGASAVANHIRLFWDPRMRRQLDAALGEEGVETHPLVVRAAGLLREA